MTMITLVLIGVSLMPTVSTAATFEESVVTPVRRHRQLQTCDDGSATGANNCCAASACSAQLGHTPGESCCSGCCIVSSVSSTGSGTSCSCSGCGDAAGLGDEIQIDSECTPTGCDAYLTSQNATQTAALDFLGCTMCIGKTSVGANIVCFTDTTSRDSCLSQHNSLKPSTSLSAGSDNRLLCTLSGGIINPGGGDDNPCFPSSATVIKADGTITRLDTLSTGDTIVAATKEGLLTTDSVSPLSIAAPEAEDKPFVSLSTSTGKTLLLTAEHHLPVGASCCASLKRAGQVQEGDTLWEVSEGGAAAASTVTKVAQVRGAGLHSPVLTNGAFPVVDGVVTAFDSIGKVTLASYGLPYLEAVCKATGTCSAVKHLLLGSK